MIAEKLATLLLVVHHEGERLAKQWSQNRRESPGRGCSSQSRRTDRCMLRSSGSESDCASSEARFSSAGEPNASQVMTMACHLNPGDCNHQESPSGEDRAKSADTGMRYDAHCAVASNSFPIRAVAILAART